MSITAQSIVGQVVANDYRTASVFKKHRIDFCCKGDRPIADACKDDNSQLDLVLADLQELQDSASTPETTNFKAWPLDLLADYIEKKHHRFVEEKITEIKPYLKKIVAVHGAQHPELIDVEKHFLASAGELVMHMKKEELVLFPAVRKMVGMSATPNDGEMGKFSNIANPIKAMMNEHEIEGERFREIVDLTNDYTPPADACGTYRVTFSLLQAFEEDLHAHIHLENNILFPGALKMAEKLDAVMA